MPCEMCGREAPLRRATIEGTVMSVCPACARFGVEVAGHGTEVTGRSHIVETMQRRERRARTSDVYDQMEEELIADYSKVIREARMRKGFHTTEELGLKIMERKTILDKIEAGTLHPSDELVGKLERELGIKLMERPERPVTGGRGDGGRAALTVGDLVKQELDARKK
ncbi:MAG: multiprotein bridging factor aMBF1 [Thermoplasmatota archaeon]